MVTHDRSIASMADRIVSITDGRIADEAASLSH
jgi:ABC-type lipoprotein export system ATPase subunit